MNITLDGPNAALLDRYLESVLLRFSDGKYNLLEATQELASSFDRAAKGEAGLLDHIRGVVEAGNDA